MTKLYKIAALPGEGIGLEVVAATLTILQQVATKHDFKLQIDYGAIGQSAWDEFGSYFPQNIAELCNQADSILFGAVSKGGLLELRKQFDFFVNLRPVKTSPSLINNSSLKENCLSGVDILFVRELVSGIYFGKSGRGEDLQGNFGYHTMQYYDWQINRIAEVALAKARARRGFLTVAHKENALPHLPWTSLVMEVAQRYPDVTVEPMLVDNLAMQLVINPQRFDVILAGNLFGDILSDLGGALVGSIGLLGSASLNSEGFGMYEAIHGTAPDLVGKNLANPLGTLASAMMMLEQWGELSAVSSLQQAWDLILAQ
ncbi:MAG: isocitrate/isopropylmalate family dehydrogenase, partial [Cyanobacteria bacterium P01_E01_bin.35]